MANIGIVSIYDMTNVGNRLQQYALVETLKHLGHESTVIPNIPYDGIAHASSKADAPSFAVHSKGKPQKQLGRQIGERLQARQRDAARVFSKLRTATSYDFHRYFTEYRRRAALTKFTHSVMRVDHRWIDSPSSGEGINDSFDKFVVGSDQVWNPAYRGACPTDFLQFCDADKRVAYAASFGVDDIAEPRRSFIAPMAESIPYVSVRENSGATLFKSLTGRSCPVVPDPTLLLDESHWRGFADHGVQASAQPYLTTYLLNQNSPDNRRAVRSLAKQNGLAVVDILALNAWQAEAFSPNSVLRTIRDAQVVVTDSFHMSLFSILFRRPLVVLGRDSTNDRIHTLLDKLGVELSIQSRVPDRLPIDAADSRMDDLLPQERKRGLEFLQNALNAS